MNLNEIEQALAGLPLGGVRFLARTGSTNQDAARWAEAGAPDLALVVADEQTAGRGRAGRRWLTPPGTALAFSLALRMEGGAALPRLTALGALGLCTALENGYSLQPRIKWPNDVLLEGRKAAGILVETIWQGEALLAAILGIGVNVTPAAAPPDGEVIFPATSTEAAAGRPVDRLALLRGTLKGILAWRPRLASPEFLDAWEQRLAYRGEWVQASAGVEGMPAPLGAGQVLGLEEDGSLRLRSLDGREVSLRFGEVRLRPVDSPPK